MQRFLIVAGLVALVLGLLWPWLARLGLGRLPGDFHVERDGFSFYLPADDLADRLGRRDPDSLADTPLTAVSAPHCPTLARTAAVRRPARGDISAER